MQYRTSISQDYIVPWESFQFYGFLIIRTQFLRLNNTVGEKRIIARGVAQNVKQVCPTFSPYRKFGIPSISPSRSRFSLFSCFLFHFFFFFALKANSTAAKGDQMQSVNYQNLGQSKYQNFVDRSRPSLLSRSKYPRDHTHQYSQNV